LVLFIGILSVSCSESPTDDDVDPGPHEDLGEFLHHYGLNSHWVTLTWSRNTDDLFTAGKKGIQAINLHTKRPRTIYRTDGIETPQASRMILSNDGNTIYYMLAGPSSHGSLHSMSIDGFDQQVLDPRECSGVRLAPDDAFLAYYIEDPRAEPFVDSLFIYDTDRNVSSFYTFGRPTIFSPDSEELLYYGWAPTDSERVAELEYHMLRIDDGSAEPVSFGADMFYFLDIRWDEHGLCILYTDDKAKTHVRNVTTGDSILCWTTGHLVYAPSFSFSRSGSKIGYWRVVGWMAPPSFYLHVVDLTSGADTCVAYSDERECETYSFSWDETRIAYVFGQDIYLDELP
jgi:hypothetical protein